MGVTAAVEAGEAVVQPGGTMRREVRVRNTGEVVDHIVIDLVGDASRWSKVEPAELNLFPGDEQLATVTFSPPRSANVPAGRVPFAVRVLSKEDTAGSVVEEGEIEVAPFTELTTELVPRTVRLKRRGSTEVAIDNLGNVPLNAQLAIEDPEDQLAGAVTPDTLTLAPGLATFAKVALRPRRTFLRGVPKTLPFRVAVLAEGGAPVYADGAVLQEAILPKWLLKAVLLAIALAIALFVLWNTLLKSSIESAAKEAAAEETAAATDAAQEAAADAQQASDAANRAAASAQQAAGGDSTQTTEPADADAARRSSRSGVLALGDQIDFRIRSNAAPGAGFVRSAAARQPADKVLLVTDIVFQNPSGDQGVIQVLRGDEVLLEVGLANFRDLDYHFVAPIRFNPGQALRLAVNCANAAPSPRNCTSSAYFAGVAADPTAVD